MLRIVTWHRIADPQAEPLLHPRLVSATPAVFTRQLEHVAARYRIVSMAEVLAAYRGENGLPSRAVLLTFDDAYRDFLDVAWPALQRLGLPATLFVPTAYPGRTGSGFWWDRLHAAVHATRAADLAVAGNGSLPAAVRTLPLGSAEERHRALAALQQHLKSMPHDPAMAMVESIVATLGEAAFPGRAHLDWDELRRLRSAGLELGAHTRTHALLTRLPPERVASEIAGSLADLRREMGATLPILCYPAGAHDDRAVHAARAAGIELAFTQQDGHNEVGRSDPLRLCRTNITRRTTPVLFALRLQPWFAHVDRWRHRSRPAAAPVAPVDA